MIASDEHQARGRTSVQFRHEVIVQSLGGLGRIGRVENVSGDQDYVHLKLHHLLQEPVKETLLLLLAGLLIKHLAQMPVGGVQDTKGFGRLLAHRVTVKLPKNAHL